MSFDAAFAHSTPVREGVHLRSSPHPERIQESGGQGDHDARQDCHGAQGAAPPVVVAWPALAAGRVVCRLHLDGMNGSGEASELRPGPVVAPGTLRSADGDDEASFVRYTTAPKTRTSVMMTTLAAIVFMTGNNERHWFSVRSHKRNYLIIQC